MKPPSIALSNGSIDLPFPKFPKWVPNAPLLIYQISDNHISATGHPIDFVFRFKVGFSGPADRGLLFPVRSNPRWWPLHDMTEDIDKSQAMSPFATILSLVYFCCFRSVTAPLTSVMIH